MNSRHIARRVPRPALAALAATAAIAGLAACGADDETDTAGEPRVAATTGIVAGLAERVAGPDASVVQVIPDNASPHDFQLSAQGRQELEEADLVIENGGGLEAGLPLDELDGPTWALVDAVDSTLAPEEDGAEEGEEHAEEEHDHGSVDPHVWMDPARVATALGSLADALTAIDPANAAAYRERAEREARRIRALDRDVEAILDVVPSADRRLVTSHDALSYFADRYGFEVVGTAFPTTGPEAEPGAATIEELRATVGETGVPAVFSEATDDPEILRAIADATGAVVVDDLHVESPAPGEDYESMLQRDAQLIADALG
jgi:ABC-type Zn uptake system ZnuABC Zn-binding protein ZnuA